MKLLLSCVNSPISLAGYDWDRGELFWALRSKFKACGICYYGSELWVSANNYLLRFSATGEVKMTTISGPHNPLLHSIHPIGDNSLGVVDAGHSCIRIIDGLGKEIEQLNPVETWGEIPEDAIHLNDFVCTPHGLLSSCFDYRPFGKIKEREPFDIWCAGGYGLIMNLTGRNKSGAGRIIGCGFNHPHSLTFQDPFLYLCSSATGNFHVCNFNDTGTLKEISTIKVTDNHFLRGALRTEQGWFLGGSSFRHGELLSEDVAIYLLNELTGTVKKKSIAGKGEIYDILPWKQEIMGPIIDLCFPKC